MASIQMSLLPKHQNRGLFSDHYLNTIVPNLPEWQPMLEGARALYTKLRALRKAARPEQYNEAQLEQEWIRPVLMALGHHFALQVKIEYRGTGHRTPDYIFAETPEAASGFGAQIYKPSELKGALAVGDAKRWGIPLDQSSGQGERNPSQQIDEYLRYSELPWGILTNGRYWRLYERESSKDNIYYAVDLIDLLESDQPDDFLYFYAFFRREAFLPDGWLNKILEGSESYAEKLSETLEDQVFDALELIAQGFLEYRRNRLTATPEMLHSLYEQSLVLLYRLLFILYAESRDILPVRNPISLDTLKHDLTKPAPTQFRKEGGAYYCRLNDLFFSIDQGDSELDMPAYNGHLFSDEQYPFLKKNAVGDRYLMQAVDRLTRVPDDQGNLAFVDYRDLDVRHLGAIYEKLLEYQLDVATESLTIRKEGENIVYARAQMGETPIKKPGDLYLKTGNNQRKVTGSYYTPDYVVRFIVARSLEPLLTEITERYATRDADGNWQVTDGAALRNAILALNVLDPATGSGHFMVDATAYIAEWLRGLALNPPDLGGDDEITYWKRLVVNNCIYGVDLNPLAVELAKLSLWLATLSRGKPLSFLDHHIKCGNSLVGARTGDLGTALKDTLSAGRGKRKEDAQLSAGQEMILTEDAAFAPVMIDAVARMGDIERIWPADVQQVKAQERLYAEFSARTAPIRVLADVEVARYFGLEIDQVAWRDIYATLVNGNQTSNPNLPAIFARAAQLSAEYRFFHWELAFPEVFFTPEGKPQSTPGFDAVIGNPPYVRQERIQPIKPFLLTKFKVAHGTADLFLYFYELGLRLLRPDQRLGYITAGTYMNSNSAAEFRRYLHDQAAFETLFNFGENQPFKGAEMVYPSIAIMRNGGEKRPIRNYFMENAVPFSKLEAAFTKTLTTGPTTAAPDATAMSEWRFQPQELTALFQKIMAGRPTVGEVHAGKMYQGIKTGLNAAFVINAKMRERLIAEDAKSAEIIKPMRRGEDLRPWYQIDEGKYLILAEKGIEIERFPAILRHLEQYRVELAKRSEPADGQCEWYELRPCNYYPEFEKPKIYWAEIAKLPRFSRDSNNLFASNKAHMLVVDSFSLLGLLNSRVIWFTLSQLCVPLRLRAGLWQYQVTQQFVTRLPIPDLTAAQESALAEIAAQIKEKAQARYKLHEAMRRRIAEDLGKGRELNQQLESWWKLADLPTLRAQVRKAFRVDIPVKERNDWRDYLADQQAEHAKLTAEIVALETRLNQVVYEAFALTPEEIALVERATKYPYGEV